MSAKKRDEDKESSQDENEAFNPDGTFVRQDLYVMFTHDRELRNVDQVKIKISQFTGVVLRLKNITAGSMENLLNAIEQDAISYELQKNAFVQNLKPEIQRQPTEMGGLAETAIAIHPQPTSGIINLRFEDCILSTKAVMQLKAFFLTKNLIETFCLSKVEFQEPINDFKQLLEGIQNNTKIRKVGILNMTFDEETYGKLMCRLLTETRQLREFDVSQCDFFHPKCFFDMCQAFITDKCRINILKIKGLQITNLEGKVLQFVLMKNRSLHTLDLSNAKVDSGESLEYFFQKLDKNSLIRYFILDNCQPDLSNSIEILGESLNENIKLEVLIIRENKIKWVPYQNFWENLKGNTSLQKINVSKTDMTDRVLEKMCNYIMNPQIRLVDLDLSRNQLTDAGLQNLSETLMQNTSIKYLNLSQNNIKDVGIQSLVNYLSQENCALIELSLMGNKINNEGIITLSQFIKPNQNLKMLDISKNVYGDSAFYEFASEMGANATLSFLDISKSKELNDEGSLIQLAKQMEFNDHLQTLNLSGLRVRKPFLKQFLEPSLKKNITLKYVIGKLAPDVIDEQLNINIQIQLEVEPNYTSVLKNQKNIKFDVHLVDPECNSYLSMKDKDQIYFDGAFKFVQKIDVRQVDFSNMNLQDSHIYQIATYLLSNPNLRSLTLNGNKQITDDGIIRIATALQKNNKLAHLSILDCPLLTNECLVELNRVLFEDNMMLCQVNFDEKKFSIEVSSVLKRETELNLNIQQQLKPIFYKKQLNQIQDQTTLSISEEKKLRKQSNQVVFQDSARVSKYLTSAIKCWRISTPKVIQIENQQLNDQNVLELCEFLKDRNMIVNLNLRRNRITDLGAQVITDWIVNHDTTITHLDVSRNKITKIGAQAFLQALKKLIRILDFQISYGNIIPLEINLAIQQEIIANNQIRANQSDNLNGNINNKVTLTQGKYELIDRGPNFMRCATKSIELLKIQHLSLPDNMIGLEEAKMLTAMIKLNPPLKTLNLENNNIDARCSKLFAQALKTNSNLQILNVSKNKLSDLGINYLLQSLIKSRLYQISIQKAEGTYIESNFTKTDMQLQMTQESQLSIKQLSGDLKSQVKRQKSLQTMQQNSKQNTQQFVQRGRNSKNQQLNSIYALEMIDMEDDENKLQIPTEEIESCDLGQLKVLNILDNMSTIESYKCIQTLLNINQNIVLYFDSPLELKKKSKKLKQFQNQFNKTFEQTLNKNKTYDQKSEENQFISELSMSEITRQIHAQANYQNEVHSDTEVEPILNQKKKHKCFQSCKKRSNQNNIRLIQFLICLCCFKKESLKKLYPNQDNQQVSLSQIIFWRHNIMKYNLYKFEPQIERLNYFDESLVQTGFAICLVFNQLLYYLLALSSYYIFGSYYVNPIILGSFLIYLILFELLALLITRLTIKFQIFNLYLWLQILKGILHKAPLLSLGLIGSICLKSQSQSGIVIGVLAIISILIDQVKIVNDLALIWKKNNNSVMPQVDRTQRIAEFLSYQGINIVFQKITLLPSTNSEKLSQKIAYYLNPDLVKNPAVGFINRTIEFLKINYQYNQVARHLFFQNFALITVIIISLLSGWVQITGPVIATIAVSFLDSVQCIDELIHERKANVSLDTNEIFQTATQRNILLADRFTTILMREKEISDVIKQIQVRQNSDFSLFDTKEDIQDQNKQLQQKDTSLQSLDQILIVQTNSNIGKELEVQLETKSNLNQTMSITQEIEAENIH